MNVAKSITWLKSSYSTGSGGECIEVALRPGTVHVRDSKDLARRGFAVDADTWAAFIGLAAQ